MVLSPKTYKSLDVLRLSFHMAPFCCALHVILSVLQAIMPTAALALTTAYFVDTAIAILQGSLPHGDIYVPLFLLLMVLAIFTTVGAVSQLVRARMNLVFQRELKPAVVRKHASLAFKHVENIESHELITRATRDVAASLMEGFAAYLDFLQIIICVASVLLLIIAQVFWAAFVIVLFSAPMFWLSLRAGKKNYQAAQAAEKHKRRSDYLGELLTGRDNVDERTMFGYGDEVNERWKTEYEAGRKLQLKVTAKTYAISKGSAMSLAFIALLVAFTLIGPVISGALSPGMFMGIVASVFGMIQQLGWQMSDSLEKIARAGAYMKDLGDFTQLSEAKGATDSPAAEPITFESLEFRDVRFKYPSGDAFVLDGLSFKLEAGRHYAFVGKNGAGKTTITKLLTGLYDEYEGEIYVNGRGLGEYPPAALKALFSVVYQDFARYYVSMWDNVALGDVSRAAGGPRIKTLRGDGNNVGHDDPGVPRGGDGDADVETAAALAGLTDTIAELKDGLATPLGKILEGGQDISGGQWQSVAIARSLLSRAPVKILDEPTAALDPISESRVYEEFEKLMAGKTTVFISHRLGSTKLADEILVIDDGRIIERGPHEVLMEKDGEYARMYESQRGWYENS